MINPIIVSVRLMTYNHANYITRCLEGIENQQTNFNLEVIIGDDFSTDNNLALIQQFIASSTNRNINYILLDRKRGDEYDNNRQKKGRLYNFTNIIENCSGKYIALLDGDDYWTDPYKLQKQVDFLEANPEYVISQHACFEKCGEIIKEVKIDKKEASFKDLIIAGTTIAPTLSTVFRNELKNFPEWFYHSSTGDFILYLLLTKNGSKIHYSNDVMGCYRIHKGGVWSNLSSKEMGQKGVEVLEIANKNFNYKYNSLFKSSIRNRKRRFNLYEFNFNSLITGKTPLSEFLIFFFTSLKSISKFYYFKLFKIKY